MAASEYYCLVSLRNVSIMNERNHRESMAIAVEMLSLLKKHGIEYDEPYLWN